MAANNNKPGNGSDRATGGTALLEVRAVPQLAKGTECEQRRGFAARIEVWFIEWPQLRLRVLANELGLNAKTVTWEEIEQAIAKVMVSDLRSIVKTFGIP